MAGFEPTVSSSRTRRVTKFRYIPKTLHTEAARTETRTPIYGLKDHRTHPCSMRARRRRWGSHPRTRFCRARPHSSDTSSKSDVPAGTCTPVSGSRDQHPGLLDDRDERARRETEREEVASPTRCACSGVADQRLTTRPSLLELLGTRGVEPRSAESESAILPIGRYPIYDSTIWAREESNLQPPA